MTSKRAGVVLLLLSAVLFVWGARRQGERVNTTISAADQSAYMDYARGIARTRFQFAGDRNRMPVFPGLMSLFFQEGMSDREFFGRGKTVGVAIGLAGLAATFALFRRVARPAEALAGTLVAAFTVFAYKAPYFQADLLFYVLSLFLFYAVVRLLQRPDWRTAVLAGALGGIAHLTKASVLPAIVLAALLLAGRAFLAILRRPPGAGPPASEQQAPEPPGAEPLAARPKAAGAEGPTAQRQLAALAVFLATFLLVVFPYIRTSKERFGQYFYNVNSTFYMWYDTWEQAKAGTRAHGDRIGWPNLPEEQIPSPGKYFQEHTPAQILDRLVGGIRELRTRVLRSYGYAEFLLAYALALGLLVVHNRGDRPRALLQRVHPVVVVFVLGYFAGYSVLYAWYTPIAGGDRLILSLLLPALLVMLWALSRAQEFDWGYQLFGARIPAAVVSPAVLLMLAAHVLTVWPPRISSLFGGG